MMDDVKIVYHIDEEPTPYLIKVTPSDRGGKVTLGDFRAALNAKAHFYKYFFKTVDDDFGVVKEELVDDSSTLPCANGRIVAWLVTADGAQQGGAQTSGGHYVPPPHAIRLTDSAQFQNLTGFAMQQKQGMHTADGRVVRDDGNDTLGEGDTDGDGDDGLDRQSIRDELAPLNTFDAYRARFGAAAAQSAMASRGYLPSASYQSAGYTHAHSQHANGAYYQQQAYPVGVPVGVPANMLLPRGAPLDAASSLASSDVDETVSFLESEVESSRMSTATGTTTTMSWIAARGTRKQPCRRRKAAPISRASSFSSMTDSTMSLNIITVTLNVDTCNFLGISIVGQSSKGGGDGGIYVGSIMKGGAVAQDGRIEPGDMLLEVNGVSFEVMTNDEAVRVLREAVSNPGPITLVVAKCWDTQPSPKGHFTVPNQEPVRPIDTRAWIAHTQAAQQCAAALQSAAQADRDSGPFVGPADHFGAKLASNSLHSSVAPSSSAPGAQPDREIERHHAAPSTIIDSVSTAMEYRGGPPRMPAPPMHLAQQQMMRQQFGPVSGQMPGGSRPPPAGLYTPDAASAVYAAQAAMMASALDGVDSAYTADGVPPAGACGDGDTEPDGELVRLSTQTDLSTIVHALAQTDSGLEIRDRIWLKITIPNAFIGSDLVDWLYTHVDGLADRRDAKKLAAALVRARLIRHTVNKSSFSEKCYYVIADAALRYAVPAPVGPPTSLYAHPAMLPPNVAGAAVSQFNTLPTVQSGGMVNDPALDEIDSVSDIAQQTGTMHWQTLPNSQASAVQRQRDASASQSAAQALQQAYANAPVQPGAAAKSNPYARYVSNPLFTAQTQQYATPTPLSSSSASAGPGVQLMTLANGPPPSYLEAQLNMPPSAANTTAFSNSRAQPLGAYSSVQAQTQAHQNVTHNNGSVQLQFTNDNVQPQPQYSDREHAKTPAALSLTPSVRSAAVDNCVCLKPIKTLLAANENAQPQSAAQASASSNGSGNPDVVQLVASTSAAPGGSGSKNATNSRHKPPPVPVRSNLPSGGAHPRAGPIGSGYERERRDDAGLNGESASATSSSSSGTASSGEHQHEHAARRVAMEQSQAVAMMSHFAGATASQTQASGASGAHALYPQSILTQIATA